jgi:alpha-tubulin suppressor-like RCC1 family protein
LGDDVNRTAFNNTNLSGVKALAAGYDHSLALRSDGRLFAAGDNDDGELGLNDKVNRLAFDDTNQTLVVTAIATGSNHSIALIGGYVYATGWDNRGQLGDNGGGNKIVFTAATGDIASRTVIAIAAGYSHSLALTDDGRLFAAGWNYHGKLGLKDTADNANRKEFDDTNLSDVIGGDKIIAIAAGEHHSLALTRNGRLFAAGYNYNGQLGLGDTADRAFFDDTNLTDVKAIAAGLYHSFALTSDGNLSAAGYNSHGQLGLGDTNHHNVFTRVEF